MLTTQLRFASRFSRGLTRLRSTAAANEADVQANNGRPDSVSFYRANTGTFVQDAPKLENQYLGDVTLRRYLQRVMPQEVFQDIEPDLIRFGKRVTQDIYEYGLDCERNQPQLIHFDAWGNRVDRILTTEGWRKMKDISAEEGVIAIAYERKYGMWSRLYQMAKIYLFSVSSSLYSCPLGMTDGAAKTIEALKLKQLDKAFSHITSRDPKLFWTSGQWMTEKRGGSDVANGCETVAVPQADGSYRLYGYKWFSSATDSDMTLTLGRVVGRDGQTVKGTKGVTMFYLEVKDENGKLNNIEVMKLKNKLGTRQVPTAELLLDGTVAYKVSEEGRGIPSIANMLSITRIHNAVNSVAGMRRILSLARDYSGRRIAFGRPIGQYPLHMQTLARMELETRGNALLVFEVAKWLGMHDCNELPAREDNLLRLMTPIAKLYTAKQTMGVISEGLETFGGQGYIEDTGLPRLLRDAQVTPIWEGTTNILSLDVLRAIAKSKGAVLLAFEEDVVRRVSAAGGQGNLSGSRDRVLAALRAIEQFMQNNQTNLELAARDLAFSLARTYIGALLIEHAAWTGATEEDVVTAQRWAQLDLTPVVRMEMCGLYTPESIELDRSIVMEGYDVKNL